MNTLLSPSPIGRVSWRANQLGVAVALITCVVFANGIFGKFIFDDLQLLHAPKIGSLWQFGAIAENRPVGGWTFQLNYAIGGLRAWHFHLANIGIHAAAACVLFGLVRRTLLLPGIKPILQENASQFAFAAAAIWAVHPLQVQSVTYISQRYESLMGLFYLLVLYCVLRGSQSSRAWAWYLSAIACAWLGAGTKEVILTCSIVALLFDVAFISSWREALRRRGWLYLLLATPIFGIVWLLRKTFTEPDQTVGFGMQDISPWEYLRSQPAVLLNYLQLTFWPDELILDRGWPVATSPWEIYGLGAIVLLMLGLSMWAMWRSPKLGFLGLAAFLILAPTSSIVPVKDLAFDHRMYLPLASVVLLAMLAVHWLATRFVPNETNQQTLLAILAVLVVAPLSLRTIQRNRDYADPVRVMTQCIDYNPVHPRPYRILANIYLNKQPEKALELYSRALKLSSDKYWVLIDIGNVHLKQRDYAEALQQYQQAMALRPAETVAYINASRCLANQGEYQQAVAAMRKAVAAQPQDREAVMQLAWLLSTAEDDAARNAHEAIELLAAMPDKSNDPLPELEVLAAAYAEAGDFQQAVPFAEQAVEIARGMNSRRIVEFENRLHLYKNQQPFRAKPRLKSPPTQPVAAKQAAL
jgi:Flp pilus assembly protein TadD